MFLSPVRADQVGSEAPAPILGPPITGPNEALIQELQGQILEGVDSRYLIGPMQRERMKFYLAVLALSVSGLFLIILLISILRGWRMAKAGSGVGKRGAKTPFVDAWAEYRLPDQEEEREP